MFNSESMNELVQMDIDLPPVKRWITWAIQMPEMADALAKAYGTKDERKMLKELMKGKK